MPLRRKIVTEQKNTKSKEKTTKTDIPRALLAKFLRQGKATKWIAFYFKVSPRTVNRRVAQYGLKGKRRRGPKKRIKAKPKLKKPNEWVPTRRYIDKLDEHYHFQNITYPPTRYVNPKTRVASDIQANPKGRFSSVTVYYVGRESELFFLYPIQYSYREEGVSFREIYRFFTENISDMLSLSLQDKDIEVIDIIALHFFMQTGTPVVEAFKTKAPSKSTSTGE